MQDMDMRLDIKLESKSNNVIVFLNLLLYNRGTFAVVRVATQNKTKQKVALKEIYTGDLDPEQLQDLKMEINVLSQLRHPCIVRLFEVFKHNDSTYLVYITHLYLVICIGDGIFIWR